MDSESPFPPSLEAAWGLQSRPRKGPKRGLSLDSVVAAAVAVADTEGIDAVSMSRVAQELGASTMALYRYVATKNELLTLMVDAAIGPPPPPPEGVGWRAGLSHWAHAVRAAILARPWTLRLVATNVPPATPNQLAWLDQALWTLDGTGLSYPAKLATALLISGHVRADTAVVVEMMADPDGQRRWAEYAPFLLRVTGDGRLPTLRAAAEAGTFSDVDPDTGEPFDTFVYGLERALDGIEAHIRSLT